MNSDGLHTSLSSSKSTSAHLHHCQKFGPTHAQNIYSDVIRNSAKGSPNTLSYTLANSDLSHSHNINNIHEINNMLIQESAKNSSGQISDHQGNALVSTGNSVINMNQNHINEIPLSHNSLKSVASTHQSPVIRDGRACGNTLSDINAGIIPASLMESATVCLGDDKATSCVANVVSNLTASLKSTGVDNGDKMIASNISSNSLLTKLIQSYKPDTATQSPLRISEFTKIPNSSLRPSIPNDFSSNSGKIITEHSVPIIHASISNSIHELPVQGIRSNANIPEFSSHVSTVSGNSASSCSFLVSSTYQNANLNRQASTSILQPSSQSLDELPFTDPFPNLNSTHQVQSRRQHQSPHPSVLVGGKSTYTNVATKSTGIKTNTVTRADNILMSDSQLLQDNSITGDELNFIPDTQILSMSEISNVSDKEPGSLRPEDMFLSGLQSADHDLLRSSLSTTISSPVVVSEASNSGSNLPELPPSPILENMPSDFLVGPGSSVTKSSNSGQSAFLSNLQSNTTENLALTFSTNFLDNSNMSIDIGSLSEGDAFGGESVDLNVSNKRPSGNELNFTNALRNVTEKNSAETLRSDKSSSSHSSSSLYTSIEINEPSVCHMLQSQTDVFKSPTRTKLNHCNDDFILSPGNTLKRHHPFSAKEFKIDPCPQRSPLLLQKSPTTEIPPSPRPDSLVQQVSCFKCQLCSYLSLEKSDMNEHMKFKHNEAFFQTIQHSPDTLNSSSNSIPLNPTTTVPSTNDKEESQPKKKNKLGPKKSSKVTKKRKNTVNNVSPKQKKIDAPPKVKFPSIATGVITRKKSLSQSLQQEKRTEENNESAHLNEPEIQGTLKKLNDSSNMDQAHSVINEDGSYKSEQNLIPSPNTSSQQSSSQLSSIGDTPTIPPDVKPLASVTEKKKHFTRNQGKPGRPLASQTKGIMKYKKSHPKAFITEDTFGIRCGVDGCGLRMKEQSNILYHRKCHREAFLLCPECEAKFTHWSALSIHLWKEHVIDMELYKCDKCSFKSYSYTKLMNNHWKTHSSERPYLCDVCGKDFKTGKQLRSHKTLHVQKSEEFMHHCSMCQRKFAEKRMLLLHLEAVHKKAKPFLCNYCGNSFASKSTLNLHIRKHTGERPFSCESCNYTTSDHNSMRRHKMKHTNERPYSCPYCEYSSIQSSTFKVHLRRKHEDQALRDGIIFSCSMCSYKTVKKDNYLAHVGTHHAISADQQNEFAVRQQQLINKENSAKKFAKKSRSFKNSNTSITVTVPTTTTATTGNNKHNNNNNNITSNNNNVDAIKGSRVVDPGCLKNLSVQITQLTSSVTNSLPQSSYISHTLEYNSMVQPELLVHSPTSISQATFNRTSEPSIMVEQQPIILSRNQLNRPTINGIDSTPHMETLQSATPIPVVSSMAGPTTLLMANSNGKITGNGQQQMFYVFGELMPITPYIQNADSVRTTSGADAGITSSPDLMNNVLLSGNVQHPLFNPVIVGGSTEDFDYRSNQDATFLQSININDGVVQLTPEVVAMPVAADSPVSGSMTSSSLPGIVFLGSSNDVNGH